MVRGEVVFKENIIGKGPLSPTHWTLVSMDTAKKLKKNMNKILKII